MVTLDQYKGQDPSWCPGCGNFLILKAFKEALVELGIEPHRLTVVSGIGQAAKLPHYTHCNTFNGLHGRSLPVATGIRLANSEMLVVAVSGDGDCYSEGGNHLMAGMRRNIDVKYFVHNNQVYGLTKGQPSPTTKKGTLAKNMPFSVISEQLHPMALAVALNCSFVARSFAGEPEHLKDIMKQAINHKGFALVDILQPCITFNKVNLYEWYRQRVYHIDSGYNPEDRTAAFSKALEWGEKIPIGVIYRNNRPTFEETLPIIAETPLVKQGFNRSKISDTLKEFL